MALPTIILLAVMPHASHSQWVAPKIELGPDSQHACVLTHIGEVKCWGRNSYGQLGIGSDIAALGGAADFDGDSLQPVDLGDDRYAVALATGDQHTCVVLDNGKAKCWGHNRFGQLGYGDINIRGSTAGEMGNNLPYIDLGSDSPAVNIWAGTMWTCAQLENHDVKCWGFNDEGALGWVWEDYMYGGAPGDMGANLIPVDLGVGPEGPFVRDMALGVRHTCALFGDGTVKCWGSNEHWQLGYGDSDARGQDAATMGTALPAIDLGSGRKAVQISAGEMHTCALLDNHAVVCWGRDELGVTGRGGCGGDGCDDGPVEMGDNIRSVDFGTSGRPVEIGSGRYHNCAVLDDASVKCWGGNEEGNLGYGDTKDRGNYASDMGETWPKVDLGPDSQALHVGCSWHTCVVLNDGKVKCFGKNTHGMLGIGSDKFDAKSNAQRAKWGDEPGEMGGNLPAVLTMVLTSTTTTLTDTMTDTATTTVTATTVTATTVTVTVTNTTTVQAAGFISSAQSPGGGLVAPLVVVALAVWARP